MGIRQFMCTGNESGLINCSRGSTNSASCAQDAGVVCSKYPSICDMAVGVGETREASAASLFQPQISVLALSVLQSISIVSIRI